MKVPGNLAMLYYIVKWFSNITRGSLHKDGKVIGSVELSGLPK
nr:MAG TPA: hypothetical protein [Caudoviricetes sp.]